MKMNSYSYYHYHLRLANGSYSFKTSGGTIVVNHKSCTCSYRLAMRLPCHQILKVRLLQSLDPFDPGLCDTRWTATFYLKHQGILNPSTLTNVSVGITHVQPPTALSEFQKYRLAKVKTDCLLNIMKEQPMRHFQNRMETVEKLIAAWQGGHEVHITTIKNGKKMK